MTTYTTVFKTYRAATIAEAADQMLHDSVIWKVNSAGHQTRGDNIGYSLERWEWHADGEGGALTCWFR